MASESFAKNCRKTKLYCCLGFLSHYQKEWIILIHKALNIPSFALSKFYKNNFRCLNDIQ